MQLAAGKQPSNSNTITVIDNKLERRSSSIINRYGDEESTTSGMNPVIGGGQTIVSLRSQLHQQNLPRNLVTSADYPGSTKSTS